MGYPLQIPVCAQQCSTHSRKSRAGFFKTIGYLTQLTFIPVTAVSAFILMSKQYYLDHYSLHILINDGFKFKYY